MNLAKAYPILLLILLCVHCADREEWKKRSIYQLLTDRFARNDGQSYGCSDLGTYHSIQATIAEEATEASLIISTTSRAWALMPFGSPPSSTTETEGITDIGEGICTN